MATSSGSVVMLVITPGAPSIGAGSGAGVPADDLDALGDGLLDQRRLLARVDGAEDDAVGLQRDGLGQRRGAGRRRALAVEDAEIPADRLGRFLGAVADAVRAAVALVGRDVDDQLVRPAPSGPVVGPVQAVTGAVSGFDVGLRLVHEGVLRAWRRRRCSPGSRRRPEASPHPGSSSSRISSFCCCWQATGGSSGRFARLERRPPAAPPTRSAAPAGSARGG